METIYKLQPHRTMHLQGFDAYGASVALWGASDTGFDLSGVFRDQADFAVLVLFARDDPFGHPRFSYLPDGNFTGLHLDFDIQWEQLQSFESKKWPSLDWPFLNCLLSDGQTVQTKLIDIATGPGGRIGASGSFTLNAGSVQAYDRVTLWYQNQAFDYTVPGGSGSSAEYWWQDAGTSASITVGSNVYTYNVTTPGGETGAQIAAGVAAVAAGDPLVSFSVSGSVLQFSPKVNTGDVVSVQGYLLWLVTESPATFIARNIAAQINSKDWTANGPVHLSASVSGSQITIHAAPGEDGNMVTFYELHKTGSLYFTPATVKLAGGTSDSIWWHISADFSALGWTDIEKLWITFAPKLGFGKAYEPKEWTINVRNWSVSGSSGVRALKVAGPGSVRIEEDDLWVVRSGFWENAPSDGFAFWSDGRAIRAAAEGAALTVATHCQAMHDIYVGTRLDGNCGIVQASLDGGAPVRLDCYGSVNQVRRRLFSNVAPGAHSVVLTLTGDKNAASQGWFFYFDFLECAVLSDVPDALATRTDIAVATDFDTDATYKLSPQRLLWNLQKIGFLGEIDHYAGVFWWKQAVRVGGYFPRATVTFAGNWADQDVVWLKIGDSMLGKSVFPADTSATIAAHFCYFINATLVGIWASVEGAVLTITSRSTGSNWLYEFAVTKTSVQGTVSVAGDLRSGAAEGTWTIDPWAGTALNRAFRDWHADWFALLKAAGIGIKVAFSQELVNPPDNPPSAVWVQRFPDGAPVETATGFGTLYSSQCAFSEPVRSYMQRVYSETAGLMASAGLTPKLQFGEILWWFQANASGMAFYDADTQSAAHAALGRPLAHFQTPSDDPAVNGYADANFLVARLKAHVDGIRTFVLGAFPNAEFELLWPLDVNYPETKRLLYYVNLPSAWKQQPGSGFSSLLVEGFQFAGIDRNLDKVSRCAQFPFTELSWPRSACAYMMGIYNAGWPWERDYLTARRTQVPLIKIWAYDHLCLFGRGIPLPDEGRHFAVRI